MRKIKIIRSTCKFDVYGEYPEDMLYPAAGDWEEVTDEEYQEINDAVQYANATSRDGFYLIVEYSDEVKAEVFESARKFKEEMKRRAEKERKRKEEEARKRAEKAEERKRKQFEKLKKELGEE